MSKIIEALAYVQSKVSVPKARSAAGRYSYRNLDDICEKLKEPLRETGAVIVLSDEPVEVGGRFYIRATATIKTDDGEISAVGYAMEEATSGRQSLPQLTGAASSYARKYALAGLLLLDDAKDPDEPEEEQPRKQQPKPATAMAGDQEARASARPAQSPPEGALILKENGATKVLTPSGKWMDLASMGAPFLKALIARAEYAPWRETLTAALEKL